MRLIAGNGILVLVPSVLFLAWKAGQGEFDAAFIAVQIVEFAAGSLNLVADGPEHPRRLAPDPPPAAGSTRQRSASEPAYSSHSVTNVPFS